MEKLANGKYQDNLEFCQWLKAYFEEHRSRKVQAGYDPVARRGGATLGSAAGTAAGKRSGPPVVKHDVESVRCPVQSRVSEREAGLRDEILLM